MEPVGRGGPRSCPRRARRGRRDLRRRLGRQDDGDQAAARPDPDAAVAAAIRTSTRCSFCSATASDRGQTEALARELGVSPHTRFVGLPAGDPGVVRRLRRLPADLRERGHAGGRDRGAGGGAPGRRDPGRRHRHGRHGRRERLSRADRRRGGAGAPARRARPTTRSCARGSAGRAPRTCASASRPSGWRTTSRRSTALCSTGEGPARPQAHRRERLREPSARAPARAARGGRRCALPRPRRAGHGRAAVLRAPRRARRPVPPRPLRPRRQPAARLRRRPRRSGGAAGHRAHPSRARGRLRERRRPRHPQQPRVDAPQRRPLPARPVPLRRPRLRARGLPADRDLGRGATVPRAGRSRTRAAGDDPLRARRVAGDTRRSSTRRRPACPTVRRSSSPSAG